MRRLVPLTALALLVPTLTLGEEPTAGSSPLARPTRQFVALSVPDLDVAAPWYREVFGLATEKEIEAPDGSAKVAILGSESLLVELVQHAEARSRAEAAPTVTRSFGLHGIFKFGVFVPDVDAALAFLEASEVEFVGRVIDDEEAGLRFVLFRDPAGNLLQLFGPLPGASGAAEG